MDQVFEYDVFISFRHADTRAEARSLRRSLLTYKLPETVTTERTGPLKVYVDTYEGRVTDDFWNKNIKPALQSSRFLIVLVSPSVLEPLPDGSQNWVEREIETFLQTGQRQNIIPIFTAKNSDKKLPSLLSEKFPRIQVLDFGSRDKFVPTIPFIESAARLEFLRLIAAVRSVHDSDHAKLFHEERRRRMRLLAWLGLIVLFVMILILAGGILALLNGVEAARTAAGTDLAEAIRRSQEKPDESALLATRALNTITRSWLFAPFLQEEERRIRGVLSSFTLSKPVVRWPGGRVIELALSSQRDRIAVLTETGRLVVYDSRSMTEAFAVSLPEIGKFPSMMFSERYLLISDLVNTTAHVFVYDSEGSQIRQEQFADGDRIQLVAQARLVHWSHVTRRIRLINAISGKDLMEGQGAVSPLEDAIYLPDLSRLVVHAADDEIFAHRQYVFDIDSGQQLIPSRITHQLSPYPSIAKDAGVLFTHSDDGTILRTNLAAGTSLGKPIGSPTGLWAEQVWPSRSAHYALISRSQDILEFWDVLSGELIQPSLHPSDLWSEPEFGLGTDRLALPRASDVLVLDLSTPDTFQMLPHPGPVLSLRFAKNDEWVITADAAGRVIVWDVATRQPIIQGLRHHEGSVKLEVLPNDRLLSTGWDGSVRVTPLIPQRSPIRTFGHSVEDQSHTVMNVDFHPHKERFVYANWAGYLSLCDVGSSECAWERMSSGAVKAEFIGDGHFVLATLLDGGFQTLDAIGGVTKVSRTTGVTAASPRHNEIAFAEPAGALEILDAATGTTRCSSSEQIEQPRIIRFAPNGALVVLIEAQNRVSLFNAKTCRRIWTRSFDQSPGTKVAFSLANNVIAFGGFPSGTVHRLSDGVPTGLTFDDRNGIAALAFHPHKPIVIVAGISGRTSAYNIETAEQQFSPIETTGTPWEIAFDQDGDRLIVGFSAGRDGNYYARLYDTRLGLPIGSAFTHPGRVSSVDFSNNGRLLATGSADGVVRLWDVSADTRPLGEIFRSVEAAAVQTIDLTGGAIRSVSVGGLKRKSPGH